MSGVLRRLLRWCSGNGWLEARVPKVAFVARAARQFTPGPTIDDALGAAVSLQVLDIGTTYTILTELPTDAAAVQRITDGYLELLARIATSELDGEISVRLTQLGLDLDEDACFARLRSLAAAADAQDSYVWLDMEGSARMDPTLDLYQRLRASYPRTGICLAACLRRTAKDVERLLPINPAIRLVKGARDEPKSAAFQAKREVDANFLGIAVTLLRESRTRPLRIALGTHDVALVGQIASHAGAAGIPKRGFEVHMLFGVRAKEQRALARSGYKVGTLIAYGPAWYRWYMVRLAERPANAVLALRHLVP